MPEFAFTTMTDLAAEKLGGKALLCSDDFFAEKENLLKPGRGIFIEDKYTDRGKWMDGWESRRKRDPGHDWCIVQLACPGIISGVDIDTNHFIGNHPPFASIDAFNIKDAVTDDVEQLDWVEILPKSPLEAGAQNLYAIENKNIFTHIRLHIYPDGGVARLKVYGEAMKDWDAAKEEETDLATAVNGAKVLVCNDMFFSNMNNLVMPGRGTSMGDGWETRRSREPGNRDWLIIRLAHPGFIHQVVVDTAHFKGNYPDSCSVEGCNIAGNETTDFASADIAWSAILLPVKLEADKEHVFEEELVNKGPFTHARLSIYPDGGVSRLRLFGKIVN